jgi:phage tail-like protein
MPDGIPRKEPFGAFKFKVEIDGIIRGGFTEVSGLGIQIEVDTIKEGGVNDFEHKLPKGVKYSDITLKAGLADMELWAWFYSGIHGNIQRKNGTIYLQDPSGNTVMWWAFFGAYPIKWDGPTLNASNNTVASESLVLTHHGLL